VYCFERRTSRRRKPRLAACSPKATRLQHLKPSTLSERNLLSPLQIAIGNYTTRTSPSAPISELSRTTSSESYDTTQSALIVHPVCGTHNGRLIRIQQYRPRLFTTNLSNEETMETLAYTSTYAAFAAPLTLKLAAHPRKPYPAIEAVPARSPLQKTLDTLFPTKSTPAIGAKANFCVRTAQIARAAKAEKRSIYPSVRSIAAQGAGSRRCATFLNPTTGL
jgi:hypothetical protein